MKTISAKLGLPFVEGFRDYHDIEEKKDFLKSVGFNVKAKEFAFNGFYWGVFYVGKIPNKTNLKKMLDKTGFNDNHQDGYIY